ncbi:MAG: peptidylprolyl isomerase [Candidatus Omnitrophota bacterium]
MGIEKGKKVTLDYTVSTDGQAVDSSRDRDPFVYVHGEGRILPALAKDLEGMEPGEKKTIIISPEEAYGKRNDSALKEVSRSILPGNVEPETGMLLESKTADGTKSTVRIAEVKKDTIVIDLNHPLAGKTLKFEIEVKSVE